MRTFITFALLLLCSSVSSASDFDPKAVQRSIEKALPWLEKDMVAWRKSNNCAACHHGPMYVWSMNSAKRAGYTINESQLQEYTKWIIESEDARVFPAATIDELTKSTNAADRMTAAMMGQRKLSQPTLYLAHALNALSAEDPLKIAGWHKLAKHWREAQLDDGSFTGRKGWPPIFNTPQIHTLTVVTALDNRSHKSPLDPKSLDALETINKQALEFLDKQTADDSQQGLVLRLIRNSRSDRPEKRTLQDKLMALQRKDGGWAQTADRESDAFATGQTLFALNQAGVPVSEPVVRRGLEFLVKTQLADGTWPMQSRPNPETGLPADDLNPITYAATAWSILGMTQFVEAKR